MTRIKLSFAFLLALLVADSAFAAGLTADDYVYLKVHWGLQRGGEVARTFSSEEQAQLHKLINDPLYRDNPSAIENHVGDYLFQIESCFTWVEAHSNNEPCPQAANADITPGKRVADRSCNACHLTGTAEAPSFFHLAQQGGWTEQRLAEAAASGHRMSPILLSKAEFHDLADYIASLK
jgi:cytochrome c553